MSDSDDKIVRTSCIGCKYYLYKQNVEPCNSCITKDLERTKWSYK